MKNYNNSFCRVCGAEYHRCNCSSEESWRKVADTAEHYQIFCVVRDYANEIIDATKAKNLLNKLNMSGQNKFRQNIKDIISDINAKATVNNNKGGKDANVKADTKKNKEDK